MEKSRNLPYYLAAIVAILTFLVYLPALHNNFVNWDDDLYVYNNPYIRSLDAAFLRWAFLDFHASYWHPLTWISHALDYAIWGMNPQGHHLTSIVFHAINTAFVVMLVLTLLEIARERARQNSYDSFLNDRTVLIAAGTTGLLFGLHPLHVESVAWVAERKDLLCALFFLLSIISYMNYFSRQKSEASVNGVTSQKNIFNKKHYLMALGFFLLALMSKPMAVTLPVVLLILDWYFYRIQSMKTLWAACVEKLPFIALSLISSIIILLAQKRAMASIESVPLLTRIIVAVHSLIAYLQQMVFPRNLAPLYPYPNAISLLDAEYFLPIVFVAGITVVCLIGVKKNKVWLSVWGYYVVTLIPVIGIVQVGMQSMADRFTYLPSLGPFLIIGLCVAWLAEKVIIVHRWDTAIKITYVGGVLVLLLLMSYATFRQIGIWKNSLILWNYTIAKGFESAAAYNNRGLSFVEMGQQGKAIEDFDRAIALDSRFHFAYNNRGVALYKMGQLDSAMKDLDMAISLNQNNASAFRHRGLVYLNMGQLETAAADLKKACVLGDSFACQSVHYLFK